MKEQLDKQVQEMTEKIQKRDAADMKKAEKDWRDSMGKDTAGHMLNMFRVIESQIENLQSQLDAANPLVPVIRAVGELSVGLTELAGRQAEIEKGLAGASEDDKE